MKAGRWSTPVVRYPPAKRVYTSVVCHLGELRPRLKLHMVPTYGRMEAKAIRFNKTEPWVDAEQFRLLPLAILGV